MSERCWDVACADYKLLSYWSLNEILMSWLCCIWNYLLLIGTFDPAYWNILCLIPGFSSFPLGLVWLCLGTVCFSFMFFFFCWLWFGCQYQYKWLTGETRVEHVLMWTLNCTHSFIHSRLCFCLPTIMAVLIDNHMPSNTSTVDFWWHNSH